jgi:hypothetical protein
MIFSAIKSFCDVLHWTLHFQNGVVKSPLNSVLSRLVYWVKGGK